MKKILKFLIPKFILRMKNKFIASRTRKEFLNKSQKDIFKTIYSKKMWAGEKEKKYKFYSGLGSHSEELTNKYIIELRNFLQSFPKKPNVVDLGCGDFAIGSKIRDKCDRYYGIDIVDELIEENKKKFKNLSVEFLSLDITNDQLPSADICTVRLVLQHMSNESIHKFIKNINNKYNFLIVTEHFPSPEKFVPNINKPSGSDTRFYDNSAVDLNAPPFNLKIIDMKDLCDCSSDLIEGSLKTKILQLSI